MFQREVLDRLFRRLRHGRVTMTYWDGSVGEYGSTGPHMDVTIASPIPIRRLVADASLAVAEAYADGRLVIPDRHLVTFFEFVAKNRTSRRVRRPTRRTLNAKRWQRSPIARHDDIGLDYYRLVLDDSLMYTCAHFEHDGDTLEAAQRRKADYLLRQLRLRPGQRLLDAGCGWGYLSVAAARDYGATVVGITGSPRQLVAGRQLASREGVSDLVSFRLVDLADMGVDERFDRILGVGMLQHGHRRHHDAYLDMLGQLLVDGGVSVLQTITTAIERPPDAWVAWCICPSGYLPTLARIEERLAERGLWSVDRENLWRHYARTVELWRERHRANRAEIVRMFDERFYRARDFWLAGAAAAFRYGNLALTQLVLTKGKPSTRPLTRAHATVV